MMEEFLKNERIIQLIKKLHAGVELSADEQRELDEWVALSPKERSIEVARGDNPLLRVAEIKEHLDLEEHIARTEQSRLSIVMNKIREGRPAPLRVWLFRHRLLAAACLLAAIVALIVLMVWFNGRGGRVQLTDRDSVIDTVQHSAILTLSGGQQVILRPEGTETIQQGNAVIQQSGDQVTYSAKEAGEIAFNKLTTPKASQYTIVLPDGSRVYLNANSTLSFPTSFDPKLRRVKLEGEAFFEVASNANAPFYVQSGEMSIRVLGTKFNVAAYNIDKVATTLTEGSVQVTYKFAEKVIKPGEQVLVVNDRLQVRQADMDKVLAWREGRFYFENETVDEIMTALSRWYDVKIDIQQPVHRRYTGSFQRSMPVQKVLSILQANGGVHFEYDEHERTVIVSQPE